MLRVINENSLIKFTDGTNINLNLLKNQIDRRFLKITSMISKSYNEPIGSKSTSNGVYCQTSCQTSLEDNNIEIDFSQCSNNALKRIDGNKLNARTKSQSAKYGCKGKQSDYLILIGAKEPKVNLQEVNEFKRNDNKSKDNSLLEVQVQNIQLDLQLSNIQFDQDISYEEQATHIKSYIRQTLSNHKKLATERKNIQSQPVKNQSQLRVKTHKYSIKHDFLQPKEQKRVVASKQCFSKMQEQVQALTKQKRMYQADNKVRANLLKKIQQKFRANIL